MRLHVFINGQRVLVDTAAEQFEFASLLIQGLLVQVDGGQLDFQGPIRIGAPLSPTDAARQSSIIALQNLIAGIESNLITQEDINVVYKLLIAERSAGIDRNLVEIEYLRSNRPIEETLTSGIGGQTVFEFTQFTFLYDNAVPDILVWIETEKQRQDLAGGTTESFRKLSINEIEFSETIPEGFKIHGRLDHDHIIHERPANAFFREYVGTTFAEPKDVIPLTLDYDLLTGKLLPFRNGIFMSTSPMIGPFSGRYAEYTRNSFMVGEDAISGADIFTAYHLSSVHGAPTFKRTYTGVTGPTLTIPTHIMGSLRLLVFRNGLLCNTASKGVDTLQYTDTSTTLLTFLEDLTEDDYITVVYLATAPLWRDDLDGYVDAGPSTIDWSMGNLYTNGDKRLLIFKNGANLLEGLSLGVAEQQYVENGLNCFEYQGSLIATDVITGIYLG